MELKQAGSAARKKLSLGNYFCVFNPMEVKLSNTTDIASPNNRIFLLFFDFNGFNYIIQKNYIIQLAAKFCFHLMAKVIHGFDRTC